MLVASELATSGSVIAKPERISPSSSGRSQRSCCSGVPNWARISMLPVSGAEQLKTSEAQPDPAHDLGQGRVLQVGQPGAVLGVGQEEVPEALGAGPPLQLVDNLGEVVRVAGGGGLLLGQSLVGVDVAVHEGEQSIAQGVDLGGVSEVQCIPPVLPGAGRRCRAYCRSLAHPVLHSRP